MTAEFAPGIVIPLHPFFGSMGVAPPPAAGRVSSTPPGIHAGNLDNRELVAGDDALHSRSCCRARCSKSATDTPRRETAKSIRRRSRRRCADACSSIVHKGMTLAWPRAETPTDYISMGTDEDLTKATKIAIQEMVDFLAATKGLDKLAAYQLTSVAGNVVITQLVDQKVGVHVKMPKSDLSIDGCWLPAAGDPRIRGSRMPRVSTCPFSDVIH